MACCSTALHYHFLRGQCVCLCKLSCIGTSRAPPALQGPASFGSTVCLCRVRRGSTVPCAFAESGVARQFCVTAQPCSTGPVFQRGSACLGLVQKHMQTNKNTLNIRKHAKTRQDMEKHVNHIQQARPRKIHENKPKTFQNVPERQKKTQ